MEIFLGIFIALIILSLFVLGCFLAYAVIVAVFKGPNTVGKGIFAALLAIFLFD